MKKKLLDTIIIGFALFAIFFGAGNLIFPPYLGVTAGENWGIATLAFLISDPLLSIIAVMVVAALGGSALNVGRRIHPLFASCPCCNLCPFNRTDFRSSTYRSVHSRNLRTIVFPKRTTMDHFSRILRDCPLDYV